MPGVVIPHGTVSADRPAECGEFAMQVSGYGHRRPWWSTVDVPGKLRRLAD